MTMNLMGLENVKNQGAKVAEDFQANIIAIAVWLLMNMKQFLNQEKSVSYLEGPLILNGCRNKTWLAVWED